MKKRKPRRPRPDPADIVRPILRACPFCGSRYVELKGPRSRAVFSRRVWWVFCKTCKAEGPKEYTAQDAARLYNDRDGPGGQFLPSRVTTRAPW